MNKATCKVRGMIQPGAMCGYVIVGLKQCGFSGECPHKADAEAIAKQSTAAPHQQSKEGAGDE